MKGAFLLFFLLTLGCTVFAQGTDTTQPVNIIRSDNLYWKRVDANTELQILSGNVVLQQGSTRFTTDSCVINNALKVFEAFGRVHIVDDTVDVRANNLRYLIDQEIAYLNGNVRLNDGRATLTTPTLEYDVARKIGTYRNGGRLVNKGSVLTSREGIYYTDLRDVYFKGNVELKDPQQYLKTDSLLYNTQTQIATFIAETYMRDSSGREILTREGFFDVANKHAEFFSRTTIKDKALTATADNVASDDATGIVQLAGRAVIVDTAQGQTVLAGNMFLNRKNNSFLATVKPLMILKQDEDSIFVAADTLFSARLTELYAGDSIMLKRLNLKESDSTNRYFEAFRNVRVYSDSVQSSSDSLFYSFVDSTFRLYDDPVVWSKLSQITGDTIYLQTKNKKAHRMRVIENSFMVEEVEPGVYHQIKSSRMDGFLTEGTLDSVRAKGLAESVYFIRDDDSAYTSVNQTKSDAIDVYFSKGELYKVVFRSELTGTLSPVTRATPVAARLASFRWLISRRPKTQYDLYE